MTWAGWTALDAILSGAAAAMEQPIALVRRGVPISVPTDMVRYWYDGNVSNPHILDTLGMTQEGISVTVGVFLRMAAVSGDAEAALDARLENADFAIQEALFADPYLGTFPDENLATGLRVEDTAASVEAIDNAPVRVLLIPVTYGLADRHPIG